MKKRLARASLAGTAMLGLLLAAPSGASDSDHRASGIVRTEGAIPIELPKDRLLEVRVRLRLPLTPPPGVQQPAAVEGWTVILERRDLLTPSGDPAFARYEFPVMRLRPVGSGELYRLNAEVVPWVPPGVYDMAVTGPGFSDETPRAVHIGAVSPPPGAQEITVEKRGSAAFDLSNPSHAEVLFPLWLALPADVPGMSLVAGETVVSPASAAFSSLTGGVPGRGRVLFFELRVPGGDKAGDGMLSVALRPSPRAPCTAAVVWSDTPPPEETMAWRDLTFDAKPLPLTVIWDFGDGRWGVGRSVRHRWLLQNEASVHAVSIDEFGRTCDASSRYRLNTLKQGTGCACSAIGYTR